MADATPVIDVKATNVPLSTTLETINTILLHGTVSQKIECANNINKLTNSNDPEAFKKYENVLVKSKVFETMVDLIKGEDLNYLTDKEETCCLIIAILQCMMNMTNHFSDVGKSIAEAGGISCITEICRFKPFVNKTENKNVFSLLEYAIATLHNIARLTSVPQYFKENKTADAMIPFFGKEERFQVYATLTAAQTLDESEMDILIDDKGVIKSILKYLKEATKHKPSHRYGRAVIPELLDGIEKLAVADPNKKKILDEGALPIFLEVLKLEILEEQALTSRILWSMSFDGCVAKEIKLNEKLMEKVHSLSQSCDKAVNMNVRGLLYTLNNQHTKSKEEKHGKHVFISYSWKQKEVALKLKEMLQNKKVKLWIDVEQMRGSTLEAMADAVENAAIVLICMSEDYKKSPNCRVEAENTFRLKKKYIPLMVQKYYKPDGWLGSLLGSRIYIDFSGKCDFQAKWEELVKELCYHNILPVQHASEQTTTGPVKRVKKTDLGNTALDAHSSTQAGPAKRVKKTDLGNTALDAHSSTQADVTTPVSTHSTPEPKLSTPADVKEWLTINKLVKCCQHFEDVNGEGLLQLKRMRHDAPVFYFETLSKKLELNFGEILNLTAALQEI